MSMPEARGQYAPRPPALDDEGVGTPACPRLRPDWQRGDAASSGLGPLRDQFGWSSYAAHDTVGCQFTNGPVEFSFHAHTCSV